MARVHILLPVHNRVDITREFMRSLLAQTFGDFNLVLIDDGSVDGTAAMVSDYLPEATILRGDGGLWWAGSLQMGIEWLMGHCENDDDIVLMINDDVHIEPGYLAAAVHEMGNRRGILLLSRFSCDGGRTVEETGLVAEPKHILDFRKVGVGDVINCLSTRGLFLRIADLKRVGGFRPRLLPHYLSDYEFTMRAHRKGLECVTSEKVYLCPNHETTGVRQVDEERFVAFLRRYFSRKSTSNPYYRTVFVVLACPLPWVLPNLGRLWASTLKLLVLRLYRSYRVSA